MMAIDTKTKNSIKTVFYFRGRFDDYMNELQDEENKIHSKIFGETYQAYVFFVLYGLMKGKRHEYNANNDASPDEKNRSPIGFRYEYVSRRSGIYNYDTLRKIVLLFDESRGLTFEEKVDDALRFDYSTNNVSDEDLINKSKYGEHTDLLDQYALGGLDLFYKKVSSIATKEGFVEFMQSQMNEFDTIVGVMNIEK